MHCVSCKIIWIETGTSSMRSSVTKYLHFDYARLQTAEVSKIYASEMVKGF